MSNTPKYTEYRKGVLKAAIKLLAKKIHNNNEQQKLLCDSLENSRDLTMLLFHSDVFDYIDNMDGVPKIVLTVIGKITESFAVEHDQPTRVQPVHSNSNSNETILGDNATVP